MTTKNDLLSFSKDKQQQNLFTVNSSSSNGQFNNLNLNQNHENSVANISSVNSKNVEIGTKKDLNYAREKKGWDCSPKKMLDENVLTKTKDSNPWNKSSQTNSIIVNNDSGKKEELKEDLNDPKNLNKSTLSLHIAAYENSDSSNLETCATKATESGALENPKQLFGIDSNLVIQNSFEFPRQQQGNDDNKKPEVGQFKASQKLVDQKKPASSSNGSSSKQQPAAPQNPNQSGSFLGLGLGKYRPKMVFETLVADLLNRFLGDFVDNLDASQLNIGIWGGDVKLNNLEIKETALDELDLPIKLKFGFLDKLVLKIPWKNLYTEPVLANIDGLYIIAVPNKGVVYNEEKADKRDQETKQKELQRLEENRKNRRKPKDPTADTFTEKMVAQVIKNLQVTIKNIHIRFEDKYTNRHRPFVAGVTLEGLNFQTTDENWKATILKDTVKIFHKLISMENLAVYWNSDAKLISDLTDKQEIRKALEETITTNDNRPEDFKYILQPITMEAKLALNQKPESDGSNWSIPKIDLNVGVKELALAIGRFQYQDILLFLEAQERFNTATRYLKYRPNLVDYHGHYREWWHFAYQSILEENIRRKKRNWSWERMKAHRKLVHAYQDAWVQKQTEKNPGSEVKSIIEKAERELDVFNLNVARQQGEMKIDRQGLTRLEDQPQGWTAWAKSWWGGSSKPKEQQEQQHHEHDGDIIGKLQQEMTPEEKQRLFDAIDYQENTPPTDYPKEYIENKIRVHLTTLAIIVEEALELKFNELSANVEQRPSARALHVKSAIKSLQMVGDGQPMLSMLEPTQNWMDFELETNPLSGEFDSGVFLGIKPSIFKYHAPAVNTAIDVFKPPESVRLNQLTALALARYEDVKVRSVTGLQHAVDQKDKLKIRIKIEPTTVVITESGVFDEQKPNLITELGLLTIDTTDDASAEAYKDIKDDRHRKVVMAAYDKFQFKLSNIQVIFAEDFGKAMSARNVKDSPYHVLKPTGLDIGIHKSSIEDLSMPKLRVFGDLPDIIVHISDKRLIALMKLALSIPLPAAADSEPVIDLAAPIAEPKAKDRAKMKAIMEVNELEETNEERNIIPDETQPDSDDEKEKDRSAEDNKRIREQQVQIDVNLKLNQIGVYVYRGEQEVVNASLRRFGCQFQMRTFDMVVKMHLGSLTIEQPEFKNLYDPSKTLFVIDNPLAEGDDLITMTFIQANEESPFFATVYKNTKQSIDFQFKKLNVTLHQGALAEIKSFGEKLQAEIAELHKKDPEKAKEFSDNLDRVNRKISRQISESMLSIASHGSGKKKDEKIKRQVRRGEKSAAAAKVDISRIIDMYLNAHVHSLNVDIGFNEGPDTSLKISDITSTVSMKPKDMTVTAGLREITMKDETPNALHKKLLSVGGDKEVFHMDFTQYNRTAEEKKHMSLSDVDMSVKIRFAQLRFVFLNLWVNRMLTWIHPFQAEAALAAQQAQVAVSEKATETAQNVKQIMLESPPRLHLDIKLAAPAIIVPRISTSNDVFLVNLGQLELRNAFEKSNNALIDQMTIQLSDMHASVGVLVDGDSEKISSNTPLLKPISFSLSLFRNLNFSQIKDLPELAVKAYLPAIDVSMSQFDYTLMMHTLAGNLGEGTPPPPAKPLPPPPRMGDAEANGGTELVKKKSGVEEKKASDTKGPPLPKNAKRIVFKFVMDKIHAGLYSSKRAIESNKGNIERNIKDAFASMKLQGLLVTGYMQEDNGLDVAITLDTFSMSDEREGKNTIKQLMDKKPGKQNADQKFVQLKFNQNYRGDKDIIINSSAFFLFLSPEFLGQLASFFVAPPPPEANNVPPEIIAKKRFAEQQAALTAAPTTTTSKPKTPVATPDVPITGGGALALRGSIQDIEIILIENALNPKNSQALILSFSAVLDGETKDGKQKINGQVKDLQIVSTYFAEEMRHLVNYYVLNRMNILLAVEIDMETQDQIVSGKIDTVHLKVSPDVIRLLSAVATQFSEHRIEGVDTHDPKKPIIAKYPNYWFKKKFNRHEYWWFSDVAEEAIEGFEPQLDVLPIPKRMEKAVFSIDKFIITLEVGTDDDTVPMILLESTLRSTASNWSSRLSCDAEMKLQISYYNEKFSVWEPIIEPVLKEKHGVPSWEKWNVTAKVRSASEDEDSEEGAAAPPKMQISIDAVDVMNITVTKSLLNLLTQLSNAFEKAAKQISPPKARPLPGTSPYLILNDSGVAVKVANSDSLKVSENGDLIDATHGDFVELNIIGYQQPIGLQFSDDTQKAELCLELMSTTREINVMRAEKRAMRLPKQAPSGRQWTLVVDTNIEQSRRVVTLKSLVSFLNHTDTPLEIQSLRDTTLDLCGIIENDDEALNVPLPLLYTPTGEFFIRPANDQYESSNESFSWHNLETKHRGVVRCNLSSDERQCLYFDLVAIEEPVLGEVGPNQVDKQWTIHIYPPMVLRNLLPFPIKVLEPMSFTLEGGDEIPVNVVPGHRMIYTLEYEESYTARLDILEERTELDCITFVADKDANKKLHLGIHWSTQNRRLDCQLYAPFWLVNNTNKTLCYMEPTSSGVLPKTSSCRCSMSRRGSHNKPEYCIKHEPNNNPILLPFADKNVASKKKAKVKVGNSAWSDEFPLDTAGTAARVICPDELCQYELTVDIQVCQSGLTKVVSFAPFYLCHNDSKFDMQVREPGASTWTLVPAEAVAGIWPMQKEKRKVITAKYAEFNEESVPFPFTESFDSFVPIDSDHLGVYVTCSVGESSSVVHIEPFQLGMAPVFVMNATSFNLQYGQKGSTKRGQLAPWETAPFKWEDVVGQDRKMVWTCGDHTAEESSLRNAYGSFLPSNKKEYHYWVCFLNGRQRYFLVTDDLAVMTTAQQAYEVERMDMQAEINIQGIGISVVNNLISQELLYMGISSSGIMWEQEMKRRFKPFSVRDIDALEDAYQKWIGEKSPPGQHQIVLHGNHATVDFDNMIIARKGKKEMKIRRNYANGLWMLYRQSLHQKQIHLKINHIQIDNQLPACIFPTVLAVVMPPKSVIADNAPKPFTEISITMQSSEHSNVIQYKYLHALVQEFSIRVDQGLINSMIAMFTNEQISAPYNKEMYNKDLELARPHFSEMVATTQATQQKAFYDDLHISPLMIHLSFSQGGTAAGVGPHDHTKKKDEKGGINIQSEFLNVLLKSVGVSVTELQDVVFKLAFFERRYVFYSHPQLQAEIQRHYTMQFVKQLYVLVLGLDIIGNPYGLVRDLSTGLEDLFYQPMNGAIQGPEEFAEGLALGVSSLFGHAVGGAAGAVSRITGTLGKGVAALTLDEDYQRKRQEAMNRRPQNLTEGLTRGAKGLGQGVFDGVTGIISKPVEGARTGGVGGFMKGVGKGLVGAVTRPVSGVVDFASSSLDAVKVVAGGGDAAKALRPPRLIPRDQIVRPYSFTEAVGYKFFRDTDRGKYADTDYFVCHAVISDRCVFIATNRRVLLAKRQDLLGTWAAEWAIEYNEIANVKRTASGLSFELKQKKKGLLGLGGTKGKVIEFKDENIADKVASRVEQAFNLA